jgi:hypothetical protein
LVEMYVSSPWPASISIVFLGGEGVPGGNRHCFHCCAWTCRHGNVVYRTFLSSTILVSAAMSHCSLLNAVRPE